MYTHHLQVRLDIAPESSDICFSSVIREFHTATSKSGISVWGGGGGGG